MNLSDVLLTELSEALEDLQNCRDNTLGTPAGREYALAVTAMEEVIWRFSRGVASATANPRAHAFLPPRSV